MSPFVDFTLDRADHSADRYEGSWLIVAHLEIVALSARIVMSSDAAQKLQLRDAVVAAYTGKVMRCQVAEKFPRVGRRSVDERVKALLPAGLV